MYSQSSSFFDEILPYNINNCRVFLKIVSPNYSKRKKASIEADVHHALDCLNLDEKIDLESIFKLKSTANLNPDLNQIIESAAAVFQEQNKRVREAIYPLLRKIRPALKHNNPKTLYK